MFAKAGLQSIVRKRDTSYCCISIFQPWLQPQYNSLLRATFSSSCFVHVLLKSDIHSWRLIYASIRNTFCCVSNGDKKGYNFYYILIWLVKIGEFYKNESSRFRIESNKTDWILSCEKIQKNFISNPWNPAILFKCTLIN